MKKTNKLSREYLDELLFKYIDEKESRLQLRTFYNVQLKKQPNLKYIYTTWQKENDDKINELNIDIDYISKEISLN